MGNTQSERIRVARPPCHPITLFGWGVMSSFWGNGHSYEISRLLREWEKLELCLYLTNAIWWNIAYCENNFSPTILFSTTTVVVSAHTFFCRRVYEKSYSVIVFRMLGRTTVTLPLLKNNLGKNMDFYVQLTNSRVLSQTNYLLAPVEQVFSPNSLWTKEVSSSRPNRGSQATYAFEFQYKCTSFYDSIFFFIYLTYY